jgi:hypothetical protein
MLCFRWKLPLFVVFLITLFFQRKLQKSSESLAFLRDAIDEFNVDTFAGGPSVDEVGAISTLN